jgi:hypothetical protein
MNRKHNPYVAIVALLLLTIVVAWICGGCYAERTEVTEVTEVSEPTRRFTVEAQPVSGIYVIQIITDTETGVQYLFYRNLEGAGLCKLEGSDG